MFVFRTLNAALQLRSELRLNQNLDELHRTFCTSTYIRACVQSRTITSNVPKLCVLTAGWNTLQHFIKLKVDMYIKTCAHIQGSSPTELWHVAECWARLQVIYLKGLISLIYGVAEHIQNMKMGWIPEGFSKTLIIRSGSFPSHSNDTLNTITVGTEYKRQWFSLKPFI